MHFDVSGPVRMFWSLAILVAIAGVVAIAVGILSGSMPRKRKQALVNVTFALVMLLGAFVVLF